MILAGLRVLLVDNYDDTRELMAFALESAGCEVHEAVDGAAVVEMAFELRPDVVS